jgi:hypothetical protein
VGTPIYMAPELMTDEEVGTCDMSMAGVYAFGILMWAVLITRTEPHDNVCKERGLSRWLLLSRVPPPPSPRPARLPLTLTPPPPPPAPARVS